MYPTVLKNVRKIKEELFYIRPARSLYAGHTLMSIEGDGWLIVTLGTEKTSCQRRF